MRLKCLVSNIMENVLLTKQFKLLNNFCIDVSESLSKLSNVVLFPHQVAICKEIMNYESNSSNILTKVGFITDPSGTGKTLAIASAIALTKNKAINTPSVKTISQSYADYGMYSIQQEANQSKITLIICPQISIGVWKESLEQFPCLKGLVIQCKNDINEFHLDINVDNYDYIVVKDSLHHLIAYMDKTYKRVILDDSHLKCSLGLSVQKSGYLWSVTAYPQDILESNIPNNWMRYCGILRSHLYRASRETEIFFPNFVIQCDSKFLTESKRNKFETIIETNNMRNPSTPLMNKETMLYELQRKGGDSLVKRVDLSIEQECPICMELCDKETIVFQCGHHACIECYNKSCSETCHSCRSRISQVFHTFSNSCQTTQIMDSYSVLNKVISKMDTETEKIVILSSCKRKDSVEIINNICLQNKDKKRLTINKNMDNLPLCSLIYGKNAIDVSYIKDTTELVVITEQGVNTERLTRRWQGNVRKIHHIVFTK